jgi:alanyl-tRNA synthetase
MTEDELERVEQEVNAAVLEGLPVVTKELPIEEAKKTGAMALFGEKYGDVVRVVSMGGYSTEFCGGTHVDNTAKLGLFHIVSESSVAAGVRRIEAATGFNIIELLNDDEKTIKQTAQALKAGSNDLAEHAAQVMTEIHERDRRIDSLSSRVAEMQLQSIASREHDVGKFKVITASFSGMNADALRLMTDRIREKDASSVAVLAGISDGKLVFVAACGPQAVKDGANAGKIVKAAAAAAGGGGGGRPDSATAGGKDVSKVDEALAAAEAFVKSIA